MPELLKRKAPVFLIIFVAIIAVIFVARNFLPGRILNKQNDSANTGEPVSESSPSTQSVFKQVDLKRREDDITELQLALKDNNYWSGWNWETKLIETEIREVDKENNGLLLYCARPQGQSFCDDRIRVMNTCEDQSTLVVAESNNTVSLKNIGVSLIDEAEKGDLLYAYCMEDSCVSIGKQCILMKASEAE